MQVWNDMRVNNNDRFFIFGWTIPFKNTDLDVLFALDLVL